MVQKIALIAVLLMSGISTLFAQQTHIVDLSGTGDFTSIHAAVDAAASGDTIRVQPDQYAFTADLGAIEVDKKLIIIGSGYMPVEEGGTELVDITGSGFFDLTSSADGTVIRGFRVQGATDFLDTETGTSGTTIEENLFISGGGVLNLTGSADTVRSNIFVGGPATYRQHVVGTSGANTQITNNIFSKNTVYEAGVVGVITNGSGVVIAYNLIMNTSQVGASQLLQIGAGAPEVYSNGFVNNSSMSRHLYAYSGATPFATNNGFYSSSSFGLNPVEANPSFQEFDVDNEELTTEKIDENEFDFTLASASEWIDAGRTGTPYLDTNGSRSDIGIFAGPDPFDDGRGAPSVPVVIQFQVSPTTVSPTGTITIQATGRIGAGDN